MRSDNWNATCSKPVRKLEIIVLHAKGNFERNAKIVQNNRYLYYRVAGVGIYIVRALIATLLFNMSG